MVVSLYGKGLTTGEIRSHLAEIYDTGVSAELIPEITDRVLDEFTQWQNRPLAEVWPVVVIDAIGIRTLSDKVRKTPVYVAMGISLEGHREILGLWYANDLAAGESASWWATVLVELQNRGINDIVSMPIRKLIYTSNMIESSNARFRSAVGRRGHFPDTKSALKVMYLRVIEHRKGRSNPQAIIMGWHQILNQLAVLHPDRIIID